MTEVNDYFRTALQRQLNDAPVGTQSRITEALGLSNGYLSEIKNGGKKASDRLKRRIAAYFGYGGKDYEAFLDIGRAGNTADPEGTSLADATLYQQGFFAVPFSSRLKLAAPRGHAIAVTHGPESSPVVVHGPTVGRHSAHQLQAFTVSQDHMAPLIAKGSQIVVDLRHYDPDRLQDSAVYLLCWDLASGDCGLRQLEAASARLLALKAANPAYPTLYRKPSEIRLVGKVIWAAKPFK